MKVGPGQSLSWPHSAHNRSRDLLRGIGGLPGEAGVDCGSLWEQTLTEEVPGKYSFWGSIVCLVVLLFFVFPVFVFGSFCMRVCFFFCLFLLGSAFTICLGFCLSICLFVCS